MRVSFVSTVEKRMSKGEPIPEKLMMTMVFTAEEVADRNLINKILYRVHDIVLQMPEIDEEFEMIRKCET